jgi:hypothetical protein
LRTAPFNAMAFGGPFFNVKLLETDVPGAQLGENDCENYSVTELRRWLECRGLKTTGKTVGLLATMAFGGPFFSIKLF